MHIQLYRVTFTLLGNRPDRYAVVLGCSAADAVKRAEDFSCRFFDTRLVRSIAAQPWSDEECYLLPEGT